MIKLRLFLLLMFIGVLPSMVFAGTTGKIAGVVLDKNTGDPLIGVNIILEGTTFGTSTDMDGYFAIVNIPPGTYTVIAQYIGYADIKMQNVKVNIDLTTNLEFKMQEASLELGEAIVVVAEREMVTKDLTATTAKVDAAELSTLPVTEISEALQLQAGFVNGHVRGGRASEVAYWIDGVPVTDSYDGGQVVEVNTDMVQQLQLISGAFNAEYGQAMSGIVNMTTKEPTEKFGGTFSTYFGDYYSTHEFNRADPVHGTNDVFMNINNFDPSRIRNFEGSIYGQIVPNKLSYIINGRHIYFGGWLYGQRVYNPENVAYYDDATQTFIQYRDPATGKGDGTYVPMNWNRKNYFQGKLIYNISPTAKLTYSLIQDNVKYQDYDRSYKLNPDGNPTRYRIGTTHLAKLSQALTKNTFYDLSLSYFNKSYKQYVYEDINDPRYVHPYINDHTEVFSFKTGGTNNQHFERQTKTLLLKLDVGSQLSKRHFVKTGLEYRWNNIYFDDISLRPGEGDSFDETSDDPFMTPVVFPVGTFYHSRYRHKPIQFSAYIQDKIEYDDFIVNVGVRMDHFRPDGVILADPTDPDIYAPIKAQNRYHDLNGNGVQDAGEPFVTFAERQSYWYKNASNKTQISPRLGASFPITSTGIIHFSYGHFFQIPNLEYLYSNPQFRLSTGSGSGNLGVIGNADLEPEQTISGELGIQQQMGDNIALDATIFFRDIRNLTGTRSDEIQLPSGETYSRLVNSDFGLIKGFIISLKNRYTPNGFTYSVDYTYQIAKGTASDPNQARNALASGALPEVQLTPLGWDQRHTLNVIFGYNQKNWNLSLINSLGSGTPYTPRQGNDVATIRENSQKKPATWDMDLKINRTFEIMGQRISTFIRVFNVLDRLNETNVYNDTGRAGFTTDLERNKKLNTAQYINTLEEWYTNATHYSEPRRIEFGMKVSF